MVTPVNLLKSRGNCNFRPILTKFEYSERVYYTHAHPVETLKKIRLTVTELFHADGLTDGQN